MLSIILIAKKAGHLNIKKTKMASEYSQRAFVSQSIERVPQSYFYVKLKVACLSYSEYTA